MNKKENKLCVVYVQGIPKVFYKGVEIEQLSNVIVDSSAFEYASSVEIAAPCNVYGTVEEMKKELGLNDTN
jgi:hypothetical protein